MLKLAHKHTHAHSPDECVNTPFIETRTQTSYLVCRMCVLLLTPAVLSVFRAADTQWYVMQLQLFSKSTKIERDRGVIAKAMGECCVVSTWALVFGFYCNHLHCGTEKHTFTKCVWHNSKGIYINIYAHITIRCMSIYDTTLQTRSTHIHVSPSVVVALVIRFRIAKQPNEQSHLAIDIIYIHLVARHGECATTPNWFKFAVWLLCIL